MIPTSTSTTTSSMGTSITHLKSFGALLPPPSPLLLQPHSHGFISSPSPTQPPIPARAISANSSTYCSISPHIASRTIGVVNVLHSSPSPSLPSSSILDSSSSSTTSSSNLNPPLTTTVVDLSSSPQFIRRELIRTMNQTTGRLTPSQRQHIITTATASVVAASATSSPQQFVRGSTGTSPLPVIAGSTSSCSTSLVNSPLIPRRFVSPSPSTRQFGLKRPNEENGTPVLSSINTNPNTLSLPLASSHLSKHLTVTSEFDSCDTCVTGANRSPGFTLPISTDACHADIEDEWIDGVGANPSASPDEVPASTASGQFQLPPAGQYFTTAIPSDASMIRTQTAPDWPELYTMEEEILRKSAITAAFLKLAASSHQPSEVSANDSTASSLGSTTTTIATLTPASSTTTMSSRSPMNDSMPTFGSFASIVRKSLEIDASHANSTAASNLTHDHGFSFDNAPTATATATAFILPPAPSTLMPPQSSGSTSLDLTTPSAMPFVPPSVGLYSTPTSSDECFVPTLPSAYATVDQDDHGADGDHDDQDHETDDREDADMWPAQVEAIMKEMRQIRQQSMPPPHYSSKIRRSTNIDHHNNNSNPIPLTCDESSTRATPSARLSPSLPTLRRLADSASQSQPSHAAACQRMLEECERAHRIRQAHRRDAEGIERKCRVDLAQLEEKLTQLLETQQQLKQQLSGVAHSSIEPPSPCLECQPAPSMQQHDESTSDHTAMALSHDDIPTSSTVDDESADKLKTTLPPPIDLSVDLVLPASIPLTRDINSFHMQTTLANLGLPTTTAWESQSHRRQLSVYTDQARCEADRTFSLMATSSSMSDLHSDVSSGSSSGASFTSRTSCYSDSCVQRRLHHNAYGFGEVSDAPSHEHRVSSTGSQVASQTRVAFGRIFGPEAALSSYTSSSSSSTFPTPLVHERMLSPPPTIHYTHFDDALETNHSSPPIYDDDNSSVDCESDVVQELPVVNCSKAWTILLPSAPILEMRTTEIPNEYR